MRFRVPLWLAAALFAPLLAAAPIDDGARAGAAKASATIRSTPDVTISRLAVRFRGSAQPAQDEIIGDALVAELQTAIGHKFALAQPTRIGDQILVLAESVSLAEARRVLGVLRMRPDVLRAELDRSERIALASGNTSSKTQPNSAAEAPVIRRFIVTFADPRAAKRSADNAAPDPAWDALLTAGAGVPMRVMRPMAGGAWVVETLAAVSRGRAAEIASKLESAPGIRFATPDYPVKKHAYFPDDTYFQDGHQRNMANPNTTSYYGIDGPDAWSITTGSSTMVVAIVDTGVRPHTDFYERLLDGYDFISDPDNSHDGLGRHASGLDPGNWSDDGECGDGEDGEDSDWHGTHVTGIFAATGDNAQGVAGVNWRASILPVRVLGTCGGSDSDILDGMTWAAGLPVPGAPANANPAKVINMSLGGDGACDNQWQSMIDAVLAHGTFVAVSAGNDGVDIESQSPANCLGVSTVAATDPYGFRSSYSNFSLYVDISAPGGDKSYYGTGFGIWSTLNTGKTTPEFSTYGEYDGTSMASPHVAGVASLMLTVNPNLTPAQIKSIMADTASDFAPTSVCRTDNNCGPGIVNAYSAVVAARNLALGSNYQGLWYNPAESGWGVNFAHQGDTIFASWFTYDLSGKGTWLVMTAARTSGTTYSGQLFQGTGPAFDATPFPPLGSPGGAVVGGLGGTGTVTFIDANNAVFSYTLAGITQTKQLTRQLFGPQPVCTFGAQPNLALATNFTDLWWAYPPGSEAGWGINLTHQGDIIFATWFTFDHDHTPLWMVVQANKTAPGTYVGTQMYRLSGPAFNQMPFPPLGATGGPTGTLVGGASFTFVNGNAAAFTYTVNGVTQTKVITREVFVAPGTVCQ